MYGLFGQVCLYIGLAVCAMLKPAGLTTNNGISYYGTFRETFPLYAFALLGATYFTTRILAELPVNERIVRTALQIYIPLVILLAFTPYTAGAWVDYVHTGSGSALFSLQLLLSIYLVQRLRYIWWAVLLIVIECTAGILSAIYLAPTHGFLLQTEIIFQIAFGILLTMSLQRLQDAANVQ